MKRLLIRIRIGVTLGLLMIFQPSAFAQRLPGEVDSTLLPAQFAHYEPEWALDVPVNKDAWSNQKSGLHVSFVSTDRSWFRTEVPQQQEAVVWETAGWRGERLNAQILIWSPDTLEQVRVGPMNLVNGKGKPLG